MYKDRDKQREAVKAATRRYRGKGGDSALSSQKEVSQNARAVAVVDEVGDTNTVIPCDTPKCGQMPSPGLQAHCKKVFAANFPKEHSMDCDPKILAEFQESKKFKSIVARRYCK